MLHSLIEALFLGRSKNRSPLGLIRGNKAIIKKSHFITSQIIITKIPDRSLRTGTTSPKPTIRRRREVEGLLKMDFGPGKTPFQTTSIDEYAIEIHKEVEAGKIERSNGRNLVQYRGRLMPIVHVNSGQSLKTQGRQPILVFTDRERSMGLAVDEIVDIVEDRIDIELKADYPGQLGSAVIKGRATEIVDIGHFLMQVFPDWFLRAETDDESGAGKRILLTEDNVVNQRVATGIMKKFGIEVVTANNGQEAILILQASNPNEFDAIFMDIEMPILDGIETTKRVRTLVNFCDIPIVAMTAHAMLGDKERCFAAGMNEYIPKPVNPKTILKVLHNIWDATTARNKH